MGCHIEYVRHLPSREQISDHLLMANDKARKRSRRATRKTKDILNATDEQGVPAYLLREFPKPVAEAFAPLSVLERSFVMAYCGEANGNATLAARLAGDTNASDDGSKSYLALASIGSQYLRRPFIRKAVDAWMQAFALSAAQVTHEWKLLTEVNPRPFFEITPEGKLQLKEKMSKDDWDAYAGWIKEVELDLKSGKVISVKLHDKMTALDKLSKILKLYTDQPIYAFNLYVQALGDSELLKEIDLARVQELEVMDPTSAVKQLPPGQEVLPPPKKES